ncbi:Arc family DNA-binding protein [Rhizobium rhizogenes]|uniref:Arc family DNA-binding protein n=1 Tax=Rhizobium rhizogenes TaxID=359 RepID=UPI001F37A8C7|nr:Arc family DNA-binding protein [Rhizobium rhizogenes]
MAERMARGDFPSTKQDQFNLRLPAGMREEIRRLAIEDGRSMNAQIVELLDFAIKNSGLDMDEIFRMLMEQRREVSRARSGKDFQALEAENQRLRERLNLWEPLVLQATPDELERLRDRLTKVREMLASVDTAEVLKDFPLPLEKVSEQFPSLKTVLKLFEEIRSVENDPAKGKPVDQKML